MSTTDHIRNFCIIAHIDHGKSTLADRFLEVTGTVLKRDMKAQLLDSMDLERERGITIKLTPVRMEYKSNFQFPISNFQTISNDQTPKLKIAFPDQREANYKLKISNSEYILNLIDTPGHVDFNYEVSRSLAAVEGAVLLVDATQGVQAQTIGNLYLALEQNLTIIPVINKVDMPIANVEKTRQEIMHLLGCKSEDIILASGKTGQGVPDILEAIVARVPAPDDHSAAPARAIIFDSSFNEFKGVVAAVRIVDGSFKKGDKLFLMTTQTPAEALELGYYKPKMAATPELHNGEIGYIVTGLKEVRDCRVGDTITKLPIKGTAIKNPPSEGGSKGDVGGIGNATVGQHPPRPPQGGNLQPLPGYKEVKPMVFAGIFPREGDGYEDLRDAIDKLKLSDSALIYEPEHSQALGFGFRCGFLGMLHLDIFQERLKREHNMEIIITVPSVAYHVATTAGADYYIKSPQEMPDPAKLASIEEPIMTLDVITPKDQVGAVMGLVADRKGEYITTEYLSAGSDQRALLHYRIPLASLITDFYDKLKSVSSGYASMNYEFDHYATTDVVKLDVLVAEEPVEALSTLVWRDQSYATGKKIVESLKDSLPKQQFELKIQAAIGGKIVASERLSALRKDVLAKMSGGDYTRKMKLLQKQKKGKARMKSHGKIDIPTEAYLAVLKR